MAISDYVEAIRSAAYGRQVRSAIADGIETCYSEVSSVSESAQKRIADLAELANELMDGAVYHETIAPEYIADYSHWYSKGNVVWHNDELYVCSSVQPIQGGWNPSYWQSITVREMVAQIGSSSNSYTDEAFDTVAPRFSQADTYSSGDYVYRKENNVKKLYRFTEDHTGVWTGTDAEQVTVADMVKNASMNTATVEEVKEYLGIN